MKNLANVSDKTSSSAAVTRQQRNNSGSKLQRKQESEANALSRVISTGRPVAAYSPPADSGRGSKTAQLVSLVQRGKVQPSLTVGRSNDKYEQEADAVAERVMCMADPQIRPKPT